MSSEEDYSGGGDSSNDDDNEDEPTRPTRGVSRRGAVPRGTAAAGAPTSSSSSRRNPRRYTTAEMDKEIAMYKEKYNDEGESGSSSESYGSSDDGAAAKTKQKKKKPVRKSGYKKPTPKKKPAKKAGSKKISRRNNKNDDFIAESDEDAFDEEEEIPSSDEESPDEDEGGEWNQNNASDANDSSDAASEGEEDDDSDSDFGAPSRKKKRGASKKKKVAAKKATPKKRATRNTRSVYQEESSEEEEIEPEIEYDTTPSGSRRPRRHCKTATQAKIDQMVKKDMQSEQEALGGVLQDDDMEHMLEEDDGQYDIHKESSEDSESDRGVIGKRIKSKKSPAKKKVVAKYDEDDSYGEDAPSEEDEGDEDMSDYDESDDGVTKQQSRRSSRSSPRKSAQSKATSYKDVDESEDDIGTADEDSNDEATGPSILLSPAKKSSVAAGSYGSPTSRQRARARMGRTPLNVHDDDESNSSDSEERSNNKKKKPKRKRRKMGADESDYSEEEEEEAAEHDSDESSSEGGGTRKRSGKIRHNLLKQSPTKLKSTHIHCPSKIDDITMMNLPKNKPHVCYIAPDGKSRHCFTLDTLYRIAISANKNDESTTSAPLSGKKLTFLQPPHFRSPMEDDLVDQIAGRFGRAALVIENSPIYKKMNQISRGGFSSTMLDDELEEFDEDGEYVGYDDDESGAVRSTNFQDRFDRYLQNLMGSTDVYCCPLCYNEADRRLGTMQDEEMWEDDESDDGGENHGKEGENADRFSFLDDPVTILGCLDDHKFEVAATFCFRLLSGVKKHLKVVHGVNIKEVEGNDLFKRFQVRASDGLLQSWLKRSLRHNTVQGDMMRYWLQGENQSFVLLLSQIDKGQLRGEQSGEYGGDFSLSFPNRAKKIWHDVKGPYLKEHDMGDFIAEEGEEESEDEGGGIAVNPNFTPPDAKGGAVKSSMEQMIENLKKRNSTSLKKRNSTVFDDSSNDDPGESSDDDELEILPKAQQYEEVEEEDEWTKSKSLKSQKAKQTQKLMKDNSDDDDVFESDAEKEPKAQLNGSARKRVIDDGNVLDSDEEKKQPTKEAMNGSARKRVLESSDEESY